MPQLYSACPQKAKQLSFKFYWVAILYSIAVSIIATGIKPASAQTASGQTQEMQVSSSDTEVMEQVACSISISVPETAEQKGASGSGALLSGEAKQITFQVSANEIEAMESVDPEMLSLLLELETDHLMELATLPENELQVLLKEDERLAKIAEQVRQSGTDNKFLGGAIRTATVWAAVRLFEGLRYSFPSGAIGGVFDSVTSEDGHVIADSLASGISYSCNRATGQVGRAFDACQRLGNLIGEFVEQLIRSPE